LQKLLGVNKVALNDLAKRGIVKRGERKHCDLSLSGFVSTWPQAGLCPETLSKQPPDA
jgi:hypothetical protein